MLAEANVSNPRGRWNPSESLHSTPVSDDDRKTLQERVSEAAAERDAVAAKQAREWAEQAAANQAKLEAKVRADEIAQRDLTVAVGVLRAHASHESVSFRSKRRHKGPRVVLQGWVVSEPYVIEEYPGEALLEDGRAGWFVLSDSYTTRWSLDPKTVYGRFLTGEESRANPQTALEWAILLITSFGLEDEMPT